VAATKLLTPARLGALALPNRVVMSAMTRNRAGAGNVPGPLNLTYYVQRASAGLVIAEATQVSPQGVGYPATPGIHSAEQIAGWRKVVDAVHGAGGRIYLQLWHVGRVSHPTMQPGGALPVAPSAIAPAGQLYTSAGMQPYVAPRALDAAEIPGVVEQFREGALNAKTAGFDGVEIHGGNGYLLDQFTRDGVNRRTDAWGGSAANRLRFPLAVAEAVAGVWGGAKVGYRCSPFQKFGDMADGDPAATFTALAEGLARLGIGFLDVVESDAPGSLNGDPAASPEAFLAARHPLYRRLREFFPAGLVVNGGYDGPRGEAVVAAGLADAVAYAKLFLANPDLPARLGRAAPLNTPDKATFYGGKEKGYTDYPALG
jgi:N-ethylmaleimide reductase